MDMEKILIGQAGRVLKAVACRVHDREISGKPVRAFEVAIRAAVERAVSREIKAKIRHERQFDALVNAPIITLQEA